MRVAHIEHGGAHSRVRGGRLCERLLVATGDDDVVAEAMERFRERAPDPRAAASDEDGVACRFHRSKSRPSAKLGNESGRCGRLPIRSGLQRDCDSSPVCEEPTSFADVDTLNARLNRGIDRALNDETCDAPLALRRQIR